jgi:hypothetical protein
LRISILDRHQAIVRRHNGAFRYSSDSHRQPSAMRRENMLPTGAVEAAIVAEMQSAHPLGFVDVGRREILSAEPVEQVL